MPDSDNMYHELTGIVFNPSNRAIGRNISGKMVPLNRESIAICNQYGYKYLGDIEEESSEGDNEDTNNEENIEVDNDYNTDNNGEEQQEENICGENNNCDDEKISVFTENTSNEDKYEFNYIEKSITVESDIEICSDTTDCINKCEQTEEFDFVITEVDPTEEVYKEEIRLKCSNDEDDSDDDLSNITMSLENITDSLSVIYNRLQQYKQKQKGNKMANNRLYELEEENILLKEQLAQIKRVVLNNFKI